MFSKIKYLQYNKIAIKYVYCKVYYIFEIYKLFIYLFLTPVKKMSGSATSYRKEGDFLMKSYRDADFIGDMDKRRSTTCTVLQLVGNRSAGG